MSEIKEDIATTAKELVTGLSSEKSPYLLIFLLVLICVGFSSLVTFFVFQGSSQSNKYYSESLTSQLQIANQQVKQFNETIMLTNTALITLKEKFEDHMSLEQDMQKIVKDHEKRILKLEVKEKVID